MKEVASIINYVIENKEGNLEEAKQRVKTLCEKHPLY